MFEDEEKWNPAAMGTAVAGTVFVCGMMLLATVGLIIATVFVEVRNHAKEENSPQEVAGQVVGEEDVEEGTGRTEADD